MSVVLGGSGFKALIGRQSSSSVFIWRAYLFLLLWAPLPLASNRMWSSQLLVFAFSLLSFIQLYQILYYKQRISPAVKSAIAPMAVLVLVQLITWLQSVTLPVPLLSVFSPVSKLACDQVIVISSHAACYKSSIMPAVSYQYYLLGSAYCMVFLLALQLMVTKQRLKQFAYTIILMGVVQAAYGSFAVLADFPNSYF